MDLESRSAREHLAPVAAPLTFTTRSPGAGWPRHTQPVIGYRKFRPELADGGRGVTGRTEGMGDLSRRPIRQSGELSLCRPSLAMARGYPRAAGDAEMDSRARRKGNGVAPNAEATRMKRAKRLPKKPYRPRPTRRDTPIAGAACAILIAIGGWLLSWWIVPIAALLTTALWRGRMSIVSQVTWGAVAGWILLLVIDSVHGRTWALARAADRKSTRLNSSHPSI